MEVKVCDYSGSTFGLFVDGIFYTPVYNWEEVKKIGVREAMDGHKCSISVIDYNKSDEKFIEGLKLITFVCEQNTVFVLGQF